jgi:hypothetical protein
MYEPATLNQSARVNALIEQANLTMSHLDRALRLSNSGSYTAVEVDTLTADGKELMDRVRGVSADLISDDA